MTTVLAFATHALRFALGVGLVATVVGVLAPLVPKIDLFNHIRPATLVGFGVVAALALLLSDRRLKLAAIGGLAVNAMLTAAPMLGAANGVDSAPLVNVQSGFKLVSWNVNWDNPDMTAGINVLRQIDPDAIAFQELTNKHVASVVAALGSRYPHRVLCDGARDCTGGIFSKWPLTDPSRTPGTSGYHWRFAATLTYQNTPIRFSSLHLQYPFHAADQAAHMEQVIGDLSRETASGLPLIIAGDFNLTPWSYLLTRFALQTGLVRHTWHRSWPSNGLMNIPVRAFPIDHIFSTRDVRTVSVDVGPACGSDHHMIIAQLAW